MSGAPQERVTGSVAELIVDGFETVQVDGHGGHRERAFALQPVHFIDVKRAVLEFRQRVVLAEKLQVRLRFLARGDIGKRDEDEIPIGFVAGKHRELQMHMQLLPFQRIVDHLALMEKAVLP